MDMSDMEKDLLPSELRGEGSGDASVASSPMSSAVPSPVSSLDDPTMDTEYAGRSEPERLLPNALRFWEPDDVMPVDTVKAFLRWKMFRLPNVTLGFDLLGAMLTALKQQYTTQDPTDRNDAVLDVLKQHIRMIGGDNRDQQETTIAFNVAGTKPTVVYAYTASLTLEDYIRQLQAMDKWGTPAADCFTNMLTRWEVLTTMLAQYYVVVKNGILTSRGDDMNDVERKLLMSDIQKTQVSEMEQLPVAQVRVFNY